MFSIQIAASFGIHINTTVKGSKSTNQNRGANKMNKSCPTPSQKHTNSKMGLDLHSTFLSIRMNMHSHTDIAAIFQNMMQETKKGSLGFTPP